MIYDIAKLITGIKKNDDDENVDNTVIIVSSELLQLKKGKKTSEYRKNRLVRFLK